VSCAVRLHVRQGLGAYGSQACLAGRLVEKDQAPPENERVKSTARACASSAARPNFRYSRALPFKRAASTLATAASQRVLASALIRPYLHPHQIIARRFAMTKKSLIHQDELEQMILAELRRHYPEIAQVKVTHLGRENLDGDWGIFNIITSRAHAHVSGDCKRAAIAIQQRLARKYDLLLTA
jgi:hypothetical protein